MTADLLPFLRNAVPPIANHLWQSTAFAVAIGLLTLLFARNRARVRYSLWLAASAKFLIPFSALMAMSSLIPLSNHAIPAMQPSLISAIHVLDQPFSARAFMRDVSPQSFVQRAEVWLPATLLLIWTLGFAAVLLAWYARCRQVLKMLRRAIPVEDGREAQILRRIENKTSARPRTRLLISNDLMEPGVFGIFRPELLWPAQLSERLEEAHLEAILAHEVAHVRRRDNLTALIHMLVEAIFWFHPFVWWIERRMLEERERACDEAVVQSGGRTDIYADGLLRVSRFCAELPLACVSGIAGADLSKRIRSIMAPRTAALSVGKKLMLAALALGAVAGPVAFGVMQQAPQASQILHAAGPLSSFEVATIKPDHSGSDFAFFGAAGHGAPLDRFIAKDVSVRKLLGWAFAGNSLPLPDYEISGGPGWVDSDRYDIDAKLDDSQVAELQKLSGTDRLLHVHGMVQALLADRFKLVVNDTTITRPVYALVVARGGLRMKQTTPCSTPPPGSAPPPPPPPGAPLAAPKGPATRIPPQVAGRPGDLIACGLPVKGLVRVLQLGLDRPIVDRTGLTGNYTFELKWTPDLEKPEPMPGPTSSPETAPPDASGPSIFTALQEQLGLRLEPTKGPVEALEIVHIEKPTPD